MGREFHDELEYWTEADHAVKDSSRVIGYSVWHVNDKGGRERVKHFSVTRKGGWEVALYLANTLRDDLNNGLGRQIGLQHP